MKNILSLKIVAILFVVVISIFWIFQQPISNEKNIKTGELSLENCTDIVVNSKGIIFCGLPMEYSIQKYDSNGKFLCSFPVNTRGGFIRMHINRDDDLEVYVVRNQMLIVFDENGKILRDKERGVFDSADKMSGLKFITDNNTIYQLKHPFLYPIITKTTPDNEESTIVTMNVVVWLKSFPSIIAILLGIITLLACWKMGILGPIGILNLNKYRK